MRTLRDLLTTWESWSARDTLTRAAERASTNETAGVLRRSLGNVAETDSLDALADSTELVALLCGWRWQAVHSARIAGASWEQIGAATGVSSEQARNDHVAAIERQERYGIGCTAAYRSML